MSTEKLEQMTRQMHSDCEKVLLRLAQLTDEELTKATPHEWAPTVEKLIAIEGHHSRDHAQQIAAKREALGLKQTHVEELVAEVAASQGELDADHVSGSYSWFLSEIEKAIAG